MFEADGGDSRHRSQFAFEFGAPGGLVITIGWILPVEHLLDGRFAHSNQWLPGLVSQQITLG